MGSGTACAEGQGVPGLFASVAPLHASLDYHLERQNVLVSNLAHVDTPGFVPRDVARVEGTDFASELQLGLDRTSSMHLSGTSTPQISTGRVFEDPTGGVGNDGNFVSLDREAAKAASNQVRYDVVSVLVQAELSDLAFAAGDGKAG